MDEIDKNIKYIWKRIKNKSSNIKSTNCPDDEILSHYIDGELNETDKEKIKQHLLECDYCLDLIIFQKKLKEEEVCAEIPDVPRILIERATNLCFKEEEIRTRPFDIILKFAKDMIEILENLGKLSISYGAVPVPLRGGQKATSTNVIALSKTLSDLECKVQFENIGNGYVNIKIAIRDAKNNSPAKGIRISLFNPSLEIASSIAKNGEVSFGGIRLGEYLIVMKRQGKNIGQISLKMKE